MRVYAQTRNRPTNALLVVGTKVVSTAVAAALLIAPYNEALALGPAEDEKAADAPAEGEPAEGEGAEGEPAEGEGAEGEPAEGEGAEGEGAEGEGAEGEGAEGEGAEGEGAEGEGAEGEGAEGEAAEGEGAEGEVGAVAPPPAGPPEIEKPEEPRIAGKAAKGTGLMIAGGSILGAGVILTGVFGGLTTGCSLDGPLSCKFENQDTLLLPLGAGIILLGTMLLAVGAGYRVRYNRWEKWTPEQEKAKRDKKKRRGRRGRKTAVLPTIGPRGFGLVGRF